MSESQKCQNFPVVALGGRGWGGEELAPLTLIWLVLTQTNTTNPKHVPWSLIRSNQHGISDFSLL